MEGVNMKTMAITHFKGNSINNLPDNVNWEDYMWIWILGTGLVSHTGHQVSLRV